MIQSYPVTIHHIYISEGHAYFGNDSEIPKPIPMESLSAARVEAGKGIPGDRFYNRKPDYDGQITLFSMEVYREISKLLNTDHRSPEFFRRNVLIEGIPLNDLRGHEFSIGSVRLWGSGHCAPCKWMDRGFYSGAYRLLQGRGGLRCKVLSDGILRTGPTVLQVSRELDLRKITEPIHPLPLP